MPAMTPAEAKRAAEQRATLSALRASARLFEPREALGASPLLPFQLQTWARRASTLLRSARRAGSARQGAQVRQLALVVWHLGALEQLAELLAMGVVQLGARSQRPVKDLLVSLDWGQARRIGAGEAAWELSGQLAEARTRATEAIDWPSQQTLHGLFIPRQGLLALLHHHQRLVDDLLAQLPVTDQGARCWLFDDLLGRASAPRQALGCIAADLYAGAWSYGEALMQRDSSAAMPARARLTTEQVAAFLKGEIGGSATWAAAGGEGGSAEGARVVTTIWQGACWMARELTGLELWRASDLTEARWADAAWRPPGFCPACGAPSSAPLYCPTCQEAS